MLSFHCNFRFLIFHGAFLSLYFRLCLTHLAPLLWNSFPTSPFTMTTCPMYLCTSGPRDEVLEGGNTVTSHNTHVTLLTTMASSESWHPQLSCPHDLRDSWNLVPHSNLVVIKSRPFPIVYSIVFLCIFSLPEPVHIPVFQSCVILCLHPCTHCLAVFPSLTSNNPDSLLCSQLHI